MVLCLCMALGVMGMGLAKWQTTLTASGGVSAAGKWDLAVTDASIKTSSGAAVSLPFSGSLVRANQKEDWEIAGRLTDAYTWLDDDSAVGTQSDRKPASYDAIFYAVNTEKFDLSGSISYEKGEAIKADATPVSTTEQITNVGTISAGDAVIGAKIAEAMDAVGKDGAISVEDSQTFGLDMDIVEGMQYERGYISPYMATDM